MGNSDIAQPAMRYHGGKFRLAPWILKFFPRHVCYVEPFGGAASVLIQKERSYAEVYNDLDGDICNFFRVLRDSDSRAALIEALHLTPYHRDEFELAYEPTDDAIERARRTAIRAGMGFGSAGATKNRSGFRTDTRRSYGTAQHVWAAYPVGLAAIGERLAGVLMENRPAIEVMKYHDEVTTLHFVDPPYLPSTRVRSGGKLYFHEMTLEQHVELLDAVDALQGMVVLCGYPSEVYDSRLAGWARYSTTARAGAHRGTKVATEVVWLNPACSAALHRDRGGLFAEAA